MKNTHVVLVLLLWINFGYSQTVDVLQINRLGQEHGLLQLNTNALALDDMGYLWVGTEDGLHRFNGYEFKNFIAHPNDDTSIADDHIRGLLSVGDTLWIATNSKGIQGYKRSEDVFFSLLSNPSGQDLDNSYKAFQLSDKYLLFSVKNNFILFDRILKKSQVIQLPNYSIENRVEHILKMSDNIMWLATKESGILELDLTNFKIWPLPDISGKNVSCFIDSADQVYIGSDQGVQVYNKITKCLSETSIKHPVYGFHKLTEFEYYVIIDNGMLSYNSVTDKATQIVFKNAPEFKSYNAIDISQILEDNHGNLWFGTSGEGLFHYNKFQNKFKSHSVSLPQVYGDQQISVFPMLKSNDSILWLGTYAGTMKYNLKTNQFKLYETGKGGITYEFCQDKNGTLWAGGISEGLMKYNKEKDLFTQWKHTDADSSLMDNEVLKIIPVSKEKLWICTWSGGINEFDIATETFCPITFNGKSLDRARAAIIDSKQNIWLGTDNGLYCISDKKIIAHYSEKGEQGSKLTNNRVFAIQEDVVGNMWLGTSTGLTFLNTKTKKTTLYYKQKGFPNDFVYGLLIDDANKIWMSTNYGLSVFNPEDASFKNYTKEDGLQDNEFNGKSFFKDNNGQLYFGGMNGFNIINPEQVVDNPYLPNVYLESVELFNKPIQRNEMFKDTLIFKSKENVLSFNFSAINYLNPKKCSYQYKLENFDEDWSPVTKKNSVTYTNLNPGNYALKLKASNDVGNWNPKLRTIQLIIVPPWYQSAWFKILALASFLMSGALFYYYQTSKLKRDKLKLEGIVNARTKDLKLKNEELNASNKVMIQQKNNIEFLMKELNHRVKNNLQIISSLLNMQANNVQESEVKNILNIAKNRILTISYIQNDLDSTEGKTDVSEFIKEFSQKILRLLSDQDTQKFKLKFQFKSTKACEINTTLLGLILNELITNTYKYAFGTDCPGNYLKISSEDFDKGLKITIEDNGKGYDVNNIKENALGLDLVQTMVHQLNCEMITVVNKGVKNVIIINC